MFAVSVSIPCPCGTPIRTKRHAHEIGSVVRVEKSLVKDKLCVATAAVVHEHLVSYKRERPGYVGIKMAEHERTWTRKIKRLKGRAPID